MVCHCCAGVAVEKVFHNGGNTAPVAGGADQYYIGGGDPGKDIRKIFVMNAYSGSDTGPASGAVFDFVILEIYVFGRVDVFLSHTQYFPDHSRDGSMFTLRADYSQYVHGVLLIKVFTFAIVGKKYYSL